MILPNFTVSGYITEGDIAGISVRAEVESLEVAQEIVATFPKSWRVKAGILYMGCVTRGYISCQVFFGDVNVQGDKNEAGIKRLTSLLKKVPYNVAREYCKNAAEPDDIVRFLGL